MQIDIFDVEHGSCALITADNGKHILIDCGHNSTTGWRPSTYLRSLGIAQIEKLIITNCDRDHASDLPNLQAGFQVDSLMRNPTITEDNLRVIKGVNMSPGIDVLATMIGSYNAPVTDYDYGGVELFRFWNRYPDQFQDENNLSLVVIVKYGNFYICFPDDMEEEGWLKLIETTPTLLEKMKLVDILVASHHGRSNGRCGDLYTRENWKPLITVISDSGIEYATQETVAWYRERSRGINWDDGSTRHVLTTRRDGAIRIVPQQDGGFRVTTGT